MSKYNSIIIVGPTATGKTKLSVLLAKQLNGEVINADSTQVYKELNIGTAKATQDETQGIPHHLMNIKNPNEDFTVSDFKELALDLSNTLLSKNKTPIFVGGTGFYLQSLTTNYSYGQVERNEDIRKKYENLAKEQGNLYVHNILKEIDKESAKKLHSNDISRVIRAIEIYYVTGKSKTELQNQKNSTMQSTTQNMLNPLIIGLNMPREVLYEKINLRTDIMIQNGLLQEVEGLFNKGYSEDLQSIKSIGYKELYPYFQNKATLQECINKIKQNTRNYAKRQLTWFRRMEEIVWFDVSQKDAETIANEVMKLFNQS